MTESDAKVKRFCPSFAEKIFLSRYWTIIHLFGVKDVVMQRLLLS